MVIQAETVEVVECMRPCKRLAMFSFLYFHHPFGNEFFYRTSRNVSEHCVEQGVFVDLDQLECGIQKGVFWYPCCTVATLNGATSNPVICPKPFLDLSLDLFLCPLDKPVDVASTDPFDPIGEIAYVWVLSVLRLFKTTLYLDQKRKSKAIVKLDTPPF
ncbi:hypothetical protein PG984_012953 [Apiospora sp. TS-2023a]